ncbi:MAG TPA: hypothetical protein VI818_02915 [Candidatus Thermoplasmatota archaeon]|nr:hypothetical protein [Candidatus Thermoplasmatota archaeon]
MAQSLDSLLYERRAAAILWLAATLFLVFLGANIERIKAFVEE